MKIENPFESGQIKNYLLFYAGVIVIMILFFIASSLFNDVKEEKPKIFQSNASLKKTAISSETNKTIEKKTSLGLMKKDIY